MTAGRSIGKHIRAICATLEKLGPSTSKRVFEHIDGVGREDVGRYCSRAVGLGMVTVMRSTATPWNSSIYTVVPGWQMLADQRKTTKLKAGPKPKPKTTKWKGVNSIFSMGAQAAEQRDIA